MTGEVRRDGHLPEQSGVAPDEGSNRSEGERQDDAEEAEQRWTFDEALALVGGWGRYQKLNVMYCGFPWLIAGMFAFGPVTSGAEMLRENEWGGCSHEQAANSLYFAANFVGNAVFGPLADSVGRRKGMMVSLGCVALGGCMCIMAHTFPVFLLSRSIVGFGNAGVTLASSVLISEVVSADVRSLVVCFYLQIFFAGQKKTCRSAGPLMMRGYSILDADSRALSPPPSLPISISPLSNLPAGIMLTIPTTDVFSRVL